jgi:hypothetical protein
LKQAKLDLVIKVTWSAEFYFMPLRVASSCMHGNLLVVIFLYLYAFPFVCDPRDPKMRGNTRTFSVYRAKKSADYGLGRSKSELNVSPIMFK